MTITSHTATQALIDFVPTKSFFVGIDSDGCAMDAMDIKHQECFTPAYIKYFDLQAASTLVRQTALFVNLYSTTRGRNRWLALARLFDLLRERPEVAARGVKIPDGDELKRFIGSGLPLSDAGIAQFAAANPSEEIERCVTWGHGVNELIAWMVRGCAPFPGVREAMEAMQTDVDCMTVSATPGEALAREWGEHDLAKYVKVIAGQEMGSKAEHLRLAAKGKYEDDHILLIGDAPGDRDAAFGEGVLFYPINPGGEAASWKRFREEALPRFLAGTYRGAYQDALVTEFEALLPADPPWRTDCPTTTSKERTLR
ncbi:hypothetical protein I6B53_02480 [Schaalia sp. 19OD2882]|uniref:HAD family hydrolase n=1 Tax=Schaalia sp. 19OD2882 TaxID=2794089 RepID=UPI001C1EA270|nr:hypothetical protein [Schaalia sp. 19OD2882]QWW19998.1 hypothetical protein I6B53_02480 [Schaalia sp. 19OD2882]